MSTNASGGEQKCQPPNEKNAGLDSGLELSQTGRESRFDDLVNCNSSTPNSGASSKDREIELLQREKELLIRELDLLRRERLLLNHTSGPTPEQNHVENNSRAATSPETNNSYCDPNSVRALIPEFDPSTRFGVSSDQWIQQVDNLSSIYNWSDKLTLFSASTKLTGIARAWFNSCGSEITSWAQLKTSLPAAFPSFRDEAEVHAALAKRRKQSGENFSEYYYDIIAMASRAKLSDSATIRYLINNIDDHLIKHTLLLQEFKTPVQVLENLRRYEECVDTMGDTTSKPRDVETVRTNQANKTKCFNCGEMGHISINCYKPQTRIRCQKCQKVGHQENECKSADHGKQSSRVSVIHKDKYYKVIKLNYKFETDAFLDLGSDVSVIKESIAKRLNVIEISCNLTLKGFGHGKCLSVSKIKTNVNIDGVSADIELYLIPDNVIDSSVLIGQNFVDLPFVKIVKEGNELRVETIDVTRHVESGNLNRNVERTSTLNVFMLEKTNAQPTGGTKLNYLNRNVERTSTLNAFMLEKTNAQPTGGTKLNYSTNDIVTRHVESGNLNRNVERTSTLNAFMLDKTNAQPIGGTKLNYFTNIEGNNNNGGDDNVVSVLLTNESRPKEYNENYFKPAARESGSNFAKVRGDITLNDVDHLGPFQRSTGGNTHVVSMIDGFTKYVILKAVKNTKSGPAMRMMHEVSGYFGVPTRVITDRGTAFSSREFRRFCDDNDIRHIMTAVRTPRANGQVERCNRTLLSALATMTCEDKKWDKNIRAIQWGMNSARNATTKKTPHELLFGFHPRNALGNKILLALHNNDVLSGEIDLTLIRQAAAQQILDDQKNQKRRFDDRHKKPKSYTEGELVLIERPSISTGESRKLDPKFKGPYIVKAVLGNDRYLIEDIPGAQATRRKFSSVYSSDKIKEWCSPYTGATLADSEEEDDSIEDDPADQDGRDDSRTQPTSPDAAMLVALP